MALSLAMLLLTACGNPDKDQAVDGKDPVVEDTGEPASEPTDERVVQIPLLPS